MGAGFCDLPVCHHQNLSAFLTMDRVWAIITTVFFSLSKFAIACFTASSFSISRDAVASSSSRMGLFFKIARAMEMRWRSPPESRFPFSRWGYRIPFPCFG